MKEKLVYLSLGILALLGIVLTGILIRRARNFEKRAAHVEREITPTPSLMIENTFPAMTFEVPEATPSASEASPSFRQSSPSAGF